MRISGYKAFRIVIVQHRFYVKTCCFIIFLEVQRNEERYEENSNQGPLIICNEAITFKIQGEGCPFLDFYSFITLLIIIINKT